MGVHDCCLDKIGIVRTGARQAVEASPAEQGLGQEHVLGFIDKWQCDVLFPLS